VVTVGEKIGKTHLTYAQGAAAELVAMGTIMAADSISVPVSTTHILSSGVAGRWLRIIRGFRWRRCGICCWPGADDAGLRSAGRWNFRVRIKISCSGLE